MSSWGEEVLLIADDPSGDFNRDRLRVDTRKWLMSKIAPKVWGDRTVITGADDGPVRVESQDASALATALLGVLAKAGAEPKKEE
jgi:Formylmethanofuran:tetrahydromethanopterin formyltransferase